MKPQNHLFVAYILLFLLAGCSANRDLIVPPPTNRDLIVLLPDPDGKVGAVRVTTKGGSQILDKPGYAAQVGDPNKPPIAPKPIDENEITGVFGAALSAQPDPTGRFISFILWFENDKTKLTDESKELLPEIVRSIQNRKPNEIYVVGHTDLVGTEAYNIELSSRRARHVRDLLVSSGIKSSSLFVSYYGKARPLVPTNDEVPEPRNRRVEVIVR
jgi:outer membrane protein OmpA-like peptidoglycan-associated protein